MDTSGSTINPLEGHIMLHRVRASMKQRDQGFTLVELLVVIIIIGILAAIAIPVFLNQRKKGVDASLKADLRNAAEAAEVYMTENPDTTGPGTSIGGYNEQDESDAFTNLTASGFIPSKGNKFAIGTTPAGYCIFGYNPGASKATGPTVGFLWKYDSANGGFEGTSAVAGGACEGF